MTRRIYMDNAATSFPKPPQVIEAMTHFATHIGASPGRGVYAEAQEAGRLMLQCREHIVRLIGGDESKPQQVIFTLNTSDALNLAIRGLLRRGDHVITTQLDHNSVLRPFNELARRGDLEQTRVPCDPVTGRVDPDDIAKAIRSDTRFVAVVHGSNVTGTIQPIRDIGRITRRHNISLIVDAAQTVGHYPVDVEADFIDLLAFPGHKGLLGPLGTGVLWIRPGLEQKMQTVREGGTGSVSENDTQPDFLPDRFEAGSHNAIGIIGLSAGVQWILDRGVDEIHQHERRLTSIMLDLLQDLPGLKLFGPPTLADRCGVFSVRMQGYDAPVTLSTALEQQFAILTRSGIHCAPLAHQTIGTAALGGTTRLSLGPFITEEDVRYTAYALRQLCRVHAHV